MEQPVHCFVDRAGGGWQYGAGSHGAARRGATRKRSVAKEDVDAIERHSGSCMHNLGEDGVSAGADVLSGAANAYAAILAQFNTGTARDARGGPGSGPHT